MSFFFFKNPEYYSLFIELRSPTLVHVFHSRAERRLMNFSGPLMAEDENKYTK